jgi:hypothetical protein
VARLLRRLNELDRKRELRGPRSSYFVMGAKNLVTQAGLDWNVLRRSKPR